MTAVPTRERRAGWAALLRGRIAGRFANAGRTYNCGNGLALVAAAVTALGGSDGAGVFVNLRQTFVGSTPALAMSFASLAFFLCGAAYDRAHRPAGATNDRYLRAGHALSAIGAATMAFGVAELAVTPLAFDAAVTGGALHVGENSARWSTAGAGSGEFSRCSAAYWRLSRSAPTWPPIRTPRGWPARR